MFDIFLGDIYSRWVHLYYYDSLGLDYNEEESLLIKEKEDTRNKFNMEFIKPVNYLYNLVGNDSDLTQDDYIEVLDMIEDDEYIPISILRALPAVKHDVVEDDSTCFVNLICDVLTDWISKAKLVWILPNVGKDFVKVFEYDGEFVGYDYPMYLFPVTRYNWNLSVDSLKNRDKAQLTDDEQFAYKIAVSCNIICDEEVTE